MGTPERTEHFRSSLDNAKSYGEVWQIVQQTAQYALGKRRNCMMLFLDDLPLQLGAYYPVGTNNIVLNRALVDVVETQVTDKATVNALVYNLLLHEYLHALGDLSEVGVRREVVVVAEKSFGAEHIASELARKSPWVLLKNLPLSSPLNPSKRGMEIVRDFERSGRYIV
ncbi:MAG: hypothetical protein NWE93_04860 [Candidatus Bathyarchaeota archaeon]|nr:hypothetical protein [Candidatus Bathyarchaeota archaeon]